MVVRCCYKGRFAMTIFNNVQWNPVNTITNEPNKFGSINGDRINEVFSFFTRKCMVVLPGGQKSGRNNEKVTVLPRWS